MPKPSNTAAERLLDLYRKMLLIRRVEEELSSLFAAGEIPGFIHLSIGQEAVPAGVMSALGKGDTIASNHRGHGHSLAKGITLEGFFLELMGKREGVCRGRGGSMHVADLSVGMLGANGIVGAGLPLALGSALAHKVRRTGGIAAAFFGDGALAEGVFHETLNIAALWKLPLLLVCENNGWSEFSPSDRQLAAEPGKLANAFGAPYEKVDGNDVEAVAKAAAALVSAMRKSGGPRLLECATTRFHGHFEGDPQRYRDEKEIAALSRNDPLGRAAKRLKALKVGGQRIEAVGAEVDAQVAAAVAAARNGTAPTLTEALAGVYTIEGVA